MSNGFHDIEYRGACLCGRTTYLTISKASNPHLCSCTMCQKASGALTVAWVEFALNKFQWTKDQPGLYQSSRKTKRCFCKQCGGLLGALNDGCDNISITIASLERPEEIIPEKQHSYKESAPNWWKAQVSTATLK